MAYFRFGMDVAQSYKRWQAHEEQALLSGGHGAEPIFHLGKRRIEWGNSAELS